MAISPIWGSASSYDQNNVDQKKLHGEGHASEEAMKEMQEKIDQVTRDLKREFHNLVNVSEQVQEQSIKENSEQFEQIQK